MMKDERLCREVERVQGRVMKTPQDYAWLSEQIFLRTHNQLSINTLKRFWGYLESDGSVTRMSTYDILAQYVGFKDYNTFCQNLEGDNTQSNKVLSRHLSTKSIACGLTLRVTWLPDRILEAEHLGSGKFIIRKVENSKLSVGDTFECRLIIENEPLYLCNLVHEDTAPVAYVAGKRDGVRFEIIED